MRITRAMGGLHRTCSRAHTQMYTLFLHLGNSWMDCTEIRYVVGSRLAKRFTKVKGGVQLHMRTWVLLFRNSTTAGRIVLKCGVWLEDQKLCVLQIFRVEHFVRMRVCTTVPLMIISVTNGRFVLKFGVLLETHLTMRFKQDGMSA